MKTITGTEHAAFAEVESDHCPSCGTLGIPVPKAILRSMLRDTLKDKARDGYRFCWSASCPIAYFDDARLIDVSELNKAITTKDLGPDVLVCYCLQVPRKTILEGIADGTIRSSEDAKSTTNACTGNACHVVNPGGICCGDQLRDTVVDGLVAAGADDGLIQHARTEDPGSTCCGRTLEKVLRGEADDGCCIPRGGN